MNTTQHKETVHLLRHCLLILSIFIAGCATQPAAPPASNMEIPKASRQNQLENIKSWNLSGAIGIRRADTDGGTASINWQQQKQSYKIYLFGPLGVGKMQIEGQPNKITLQSSSGDTFEAKTAEALLQQQVGWNIPVSQLYYWIRALPAPVTPARKHFDKYNHLIRLDQNGWQIYYDRYTSVDGIDLPSKMSMMFGELRIKLVISEWNLISN